MAILDFVKNIRNYKRYDGEIGLEIETETKEPYIIPGFAYWNVHEDGSLRDFGREYVLRSPLKYEKELPSALDEFATKTKDIKFIKDSPTTSVHVHLNMLNESFRTMGNFLTLYTLFENLLIRYSGEDRRSNLFCLPICDAEDTYKNIVHMFNLIEQKNYKGLFFQENQVKYAALNLGAFNNYGSLEIRSFRGETDPKVIKTWIDILYSMLAYARNDITPREIMLKWREREGFFLDDVFGKYASAIHRRDEISLIKENIWYAASIAYSVKGDWRLLDAIQEKPKFSPKAKDLEALALKLLKKHWADLDPGEADFILKQAEANFYGKKEKLAAEGDFFARPPIPVRRNPARIIDDPVARAVPEAVPGAWGQILDNADGLAPGEVAIQRDGIVINEANIDAARNDFVQAVANLQNRMRVRDR